METVADHVQPPLHQIEHRLRRWVNFGVMPLFALANASVDLQHSAISRALNPITFGILLGLVVGKPLGIVTGTWVAIRATGARLPQGTNRRQLHGIAGLGGVGFTMALSIAHMAFPGARLQEAKIGIPAGTAVAGAVGTWLLALAPRPKKRAAE